VIGQQADVTFVARRGGEAIGFLGAKLQQTDELNFGVIVLTAVAEKDRGRGVGGALVRTACAWARERSATSMIVRTEVPNTTAVRLYERHGFTAASSGIYLARWRKKERTYD
jgi:ribosomal protein S18 acetylase RimI-like enzyme